MNTAENTIAVTETPENNSAWTDPAACIAAARADVDAVPTVCIRSAYRDLSCKMSGPECFRRVAYAPQAGDVTTEWPDAERLPGRSIRASERRASVSCEVPVGTLVQDFERAVYRGSKGRCSVTFGIVVMNDEGKSAIEWLTHRTLRKRPVYEVTLPTGELCFVARRD